jgi:hypothetical protein
MLQLYRHILRAARDFPSVGGAVAVARAAAAALGPSCSLETAPRPAAWAGLLLTAPPAHLPGAQVKRGSIIREIKAEFRANRVGSSEPRGW